MRYTPDYPTPQTDAYGLPIAASRERLSSLMTPLQKFVFPAIWPVMVFFFWRQLSQTGDLEVFGTPMVFFVVVGGGGMAAVLWYATKLYKVQREGPDLILSNYGHEIRVPLAEVAEVKCARWSKSKEITLYFRNPTEFGSKITFVPRTDFIFGWREHPMAEEIRDLARDHWYHAQGRSWVDRPERKEYMPSWVHPDPSERGKNIPEWPDEKRPRTDKDHSF